MGVAFWIVLIALIVLLVRGGRTTARASGEPAARPLDERGVTAPAGAGRRLRRPVEGR